MASSVQSYICGECGWFINSACTDLAEHQCFNTFDENQHQFVVDDGSHVQMVPLEVQVTQNMEMGNVKPSVKQPSSDLGKLKWRHDAIICLISLYKQHLQEFQSTKEKANKVWGRVALALQADGFNYTTQQCLFKFKYLKSKYMQKKDNDRSTGQAFITFKYFENLDEIFGTKPNVQPRTLASNLVQRKLPLENQADRFDEDALQNNNLNHVQEVQPPQKKQKRSGIRDLTIEMKNREEGHERRHQENMELKRQLLDSFNNKMDALINCLNKD